jgi:hypothetical protein
MAHFSTAVQLRKFASLPPASTGQPCTLCKMPHGQQLKGILHARPAHQNAPHSIKPYMEGCWHQGYQNLATIASASAQHRLHECRMRRLRSHCHVRCKQCMLCKSAAYLLTCHSKQMLCPKYAAYSQKYLVEGLMCRQRAPMYTQPAADASSTQRPTSQHTTFNLARCSLQPLGYIKL